MTTDNWINLISAIIVGGGTITLAIMAYKAIRQTRHIQKNQYKQELLNDIWRWATELSNFQIEPMTDVPVKSIEAIYLWSASVWANFLASKDAIGESLKRRVEVIYPSIGSLIEDVLKKIELTSIGIKHPSATLPKDDVLKIIRNLGDCVLELYESTEKVIEEIDKIKITS